MRKPGRKVSEPRPTLKAKTSSTRPMPPQAVKVKLQNKPKTSEETADDYLRNSRDPKVQALIGKTPKK